MWGRGLAAKRPAPRASCNLHPRPVGSGPGQQRPCPALGPACPSVSRPVGCCRQSLRPMTIVTRPALPTPRYATLKAKGPDGHIMCGHSGTRQRTPVSCRPAARAVVRGTTSWSGAVPLPLFCVGRPAGGSSARTKTCRAMLACATRLSPHVCGCCWVCHGTAAQGRV